MLVLYNGQYRNIDNFYDLNTTYHAKYLQCLLSDTSLHLDYKFDVPKISQVMTSMNNKIFASEGVFRQSRCCLLVINLTF